MLFGQEQLLRLIRSHRQGQSLGVRVGRRFGGRWWRRGGRDGRIGRGILVSADRFRDKVGCRRGRVVSREDVGDGENLNVLQESADNVLANRVLPISNQDVDVVTWKNQAARGD